MYVTGEKARVCMTDVLHIKLDILFLIQSLLLVSLIMIVGQGNSAPEEGLVCQGQFLSAVSEALALRNAFQAKSAEVKRFLDTCERAVADDCCQVCI